MKNTQMKTIAERMTQSPTRVMVKVFDPTQMLAKVSAEKGHAVVCTSIREGVIEVQGGIIFVDNEGIHSSKVLPLEATMPVSLVTPTVEVPPTDSKFGSIVGGDPVCGVHVPASYVLRHVAEEVRLSDFIRHFGGRLDRNFEDVIAVLRGEGVDVDDELSARGHGRLNQAATNPAKGFSQGRL